MTFHPACSKICIVRKLYREVFGAWLRRPFCMPERKTTMHMKPKRPCSWPGCPKLTVSRYCEEHTRQADRNYEKYERDPATRQYYGTEWQKVRRAYISHHPLCEECLKQGRVVPVAQVHHKRPRREGGTNDFSNLMSLCASCHARIHAEHGDWWHRK